MAGSVGDFLSSIGKTPGPLGTDHSPVFARFCSPVANPCNGSLPAVFSPPPAAPTRWRLDERGSTSYHDLLLQWSHHEHLSELSRGRAAFRQARADIYLLAYAASALDLITLTMNTKSAPPRQGLHSSLSSRYTSTHIAEQLETIVAHLRPNLPPSAVFPPPLSGATTEGDIAPAVPDDGHADTDGGGDDEIGSKSGTDGRRHGFSGDPR